MICVKSFGDQDMGNFLKDIFEIADTLLLDPDDLVQKGYGWMLKAASRTHQKEIFDYIIKKKTIMPRTALRYAIEKMPKELKIKAMGKEYDRFIIRSSEKNST